MGPPRKLSSKVQTSRVCTAFRPTSNHWKIQKLFCSLWPFITTFSPISSLIRTISGARSCGSAITCKWTEGTFLGIQFLPWRRHNLTFGKILFRYSIIKRKKHLVILFEFLHLCVLRECSRSKDGFWYIWVYMLGTTTEAECYRCIIKIRQADGVSRAPRFAAQSKICPQNEGH